MKRILPFLLVFLSGLFLVSNPVNGQRLQAEWLNLTGGDYSPGPPMVGFDQAGNIYQAGTFTGATLNIGPFAITGGPNGSAYVARTDAGGNVSWVQSFGTDGYVFPVGFHVDKEGNTRLAGSFSGSYLSLPGDTLKNTLQGDAYFYLMLDPSGTPVDFSFLAEPLPTASFSISSGWFDEQGNLTLTGINDWSGDTLAFRGMGLSVEKTGNSTLFVVHISKDGSPLWGVSSRTTFGEYIQLMDPRVITDNTGSVFLTGLYDGLDMVPVFGSDTLKNLSAGNIFVVKFDQDGNFVWYRSTEGSAYPFLDELLSDSQGNLIISGAFYNDTIRFGSFEISNPDNVDDLFLLRIGPDGAEQFLKHLNTNNYGGQKGKGGVAGGYYSALAVDHLDNIYLASYFNDSVLIFSGDTLSNVQGGDLFAVKYDQNGNFQWVRGIPGYFYKAPFIALDNHDRLFILENIDTDFTLDTLSFVNVPYATSLFLLGLQEEGTAFYGNSMTTSTNEWADPYGLFADDKGHLVATGYFSSDIMADDKTLTSTYPSNVFTARFSYLTRMNGTVTDASAAPVDSSWVYLYKLQSSGVDPIFDSVRVQPTGTYTFADFEYGDYLIYALADTQPYPQAIGTYFGNEAFWNLADTVQASQDTLTGLDIQLIELTVPLDGTGTVEGVIEYDTSSLKSTASIAGEPVKKVKVILIGTQKSSNNVIAWVYTNEQGQFVFENIPDGNYSIIVDIPGLPMDSTYTVNVTGNVVSGLDFLVSKTEILVNTTSGVDQPLVDVPEFRVWPNPTSGLLEVALPDGRLEGITVFDIRGTVVRQINSESKVPQMKLDLSGLPAGVYYLRISSDSGTGVSRVVIQH